MVWMRVDTFFQIKKEFGGSHHIFSIRTREVCHWNYETCPELKCFWCLMTPPVCLFALSTQQFDIAIDLCRLVLWEQSAQFQQSIGNACLWLIHGLAFATIVTLVSLT